MRVLFITYIAFILNIGQSFAQEALILKKYTSEINDSKIPLLFDYSYAGYKLGTDGIPEKHSGLTVYNVLDFAAIPNDSISDQEAVQIAIYEAEKNNGGIIYFPPGEFLVNVNPSTSNPITINESNVILKRRGLGKGGTIVHMKDHMLQSFPGQPEWQVNCMIKFVSETKNKSKTKITANSKEGDFVHDVENADLFHKAKYIHLEMPYNLQTVSTYLDGKPIRSHWEKVKEKGVSFIENHEIESIKGNKITLKDFLINTIEVSKNWQTNQYFPLENEGVEDIYFKANFKEAYEHHKDFIHDNAKPIISMNSVASSCVRRCGFSNITGAVALNNSCASSILMLFIDGNSGHKLTIVTMSSRVLTGLITDATESGQFHGASMSHKISGYVIWLVKTTKQGWDSHADIPKNNLVDMYEGSKMTNHGGFYKNESHHLKGLTLWNHKRVGETQDNYDFWKLSGPKQLYWGFSAVNSTVVGMHGSITTFNQENLGYLESLGQAVFPESLHEAQLKYGLGKIPKWIEKYQKVWYKIVRELA